MEEYDEEDQDLSPTIAPISSPALVFESTHDSTPITQEEIDEVIQGKVNQRITYDELRDANLLLHNLKAGFRYATTITALTKLAHTIMDVHKSRRMLMKEASNIKIDTQEDIEFDIMGRVIKR